jgi:predicted DNA-binding transcriptional regulator YafY
MLLLQVHGRMSGRDLAKRLEVSERTIHRDMEALSLSGVPVYAERGSQGGWALSEAYRTNLTGLNSSEAQALALAIPAQLLADLGLDRASDAAYIKLMAALPGANRQDAEFMRQRIHVDMGGWQQYEEPAPFLDVIQNALWQEYKLKVAYQRNDGSVVERVLDPLGLVAKGCVWYLVACVDQEPRTYRVSRIQQAALLEEIVERPAGFNLADFWEKSKNEFKATLPRYPVVVKLAAGMLERMRYSGRYTRLERVEVLSEPDEAGWQTVRIQFEKEIEAFEFLLSFGVRVEVLEPLELRRKIIGMAKDLLAFYEGKEK